MREFNKTISKTVFKNREVRPRNILQRLCKNQSYVPTIAQRNYREWLIHRCVGGAEGI